MRETRNEMKIRGVMMSWGAVSECNNKWGEMRCRKWKRGC